ncbi:unnamed protein product [Cylindrotheca closterium]|uniref:BspA family leucine-rich repeat surface protein n=1 Tax=Cylindrotheca closterium TaxID=2856 RepID=A0AAD2G416_9STRA|nr:unnamed protein product [Cylindrotheca closterium]
MYETFRLARAFNQDLSSWDVSSVTEMVLMFEEASAFNADISSWDVSSVTNMSEMFKGAASFNQDLSSWDVSSVASLRVLFREASSFNQNLCAWGARLSNTVDTVDAFSANSCPSPGNPNLLSTPASPFYHGCV